MFPFRPRAALARYARPFRSAIRVVNGLLLLNLLYESGHLIVAVRYHLGGPSEPYLIAAVLLLILALVVALTRLTARLAELEMKVAQDAAAARAARARRARRPSELEEKLTILTGIDHNLHHLVRNLTVRKPGEESWQKSPAFVAAKLVVTCDQISAAFSQVFAPGLNFRTTIKGFINSRQVVTVARDGRSLRALSADYDAHRPVNVAEQTDFNALADPQVTCYACDDLVAAQKRDYRNTTRNWFRHYSAAMVVPIRMLIGQEGRWLFDLAGYLAVDALPSPGQRVFCQLNGQPREDQRSFMLGAADGIFSVLKRGALAARETGDKGYKRDSRNFPNAAELHQGYLSLVRSRVGQRRPVSKY